MYTATTNYPYKMAMTTPTVECS